jgi:Reverse transcriptase (RNA-dependent DNA polymerase)
VQFTTPPKGKSPGPDGLPIEFWSSQVWLHQHLVDLFNEWVAAGEIPATFNKGTITLLYKKGDPTDIANYRPITLLNSIVKILTKILANTLKTVAPHLINSHQTGIASRFIGTNIRLVSDTLKLMRESNLNCGVIFLDQEKAFDMVSHSYLLSVLSKMGFGKNFIKWIAILYANPSSHVKVNNILSPPIFLKRGVRQGDCLSPILYALSIEPLLQAIVNDPLILGFNNQKVSAYADDIACFLQRTNDLQHLDKWLNIFSKATGARVNWKKTEGFYMNDLPVLPSAMPISWSQPTAHIKYLGIQLSLSPDTSMSWQLVLNKLIASCTSWKRCNLSLKGKMVVISNQLIPIITYTASALPCPTTIMKQLHKIIWSFLWNGKSQGQY